ncbi:hypothetical protein [Mycolicibacterium stellerae]|uniref:hypothetical protein n=1 Tax=Mycolicibacterium stellerae TaxID=2358193 RepID=UPI000F0B0134|nr:hypothetical protein [Mycolicibacterium stellerae]
MKTIVYGLAAGAVLAGAAIGFAGPASAEPLTGSYNGTLIDGAGQVLNPDPVGLTFSACGPDCTHMTTPSQEIDLHLQGGAWVAGYDWNGSPCTITLDGNGTVLDDVCPNEQPLRMSLTKIA